MNSFQSSSSSVVSSSSSSSASSSSATILTNSSSNKNIAQHELTKNKNYFDNLIYSQKMFGTMSSNETKPTYYTELKLKIEQLIRPKDNRSALSETDSSSNTNSSNNSKLSIIDNNVIFSSKLNNDSESPNSISSSSSFDENFITSLFNLFFSYDFKGKFQNYSK